MSSKIKRILFLALLVKILPVYTYTDAGSVSFSLKKLLVLKEKNGFLACVYIDVETCDKLDEGCAIVSGVNNYDEMKIAKIIKLSEEAKTLEVSIGDTGEQTLAKFR